MTRIQAGLFLVLWLGSGALLAAQNDNAGKATDSFSPPYSAEQLRQLNKEFHQARLQQESGDLAAAIRTYQQILQFFPQVPEASNNLAVLLAEEGRLDEAKATLEQAFRAQESYAAVYDNLRTINLELARDSYIKALRLGVKPKKLALKKLGELSISNQQVRVAAGPAAGSPDTAEVKPKPVDTSGTLETARQDVVTTLQGWAAAWSAQDPDLYLSFYSKKFVPPRNLSRTSWERLRRDRLKQPSWIKVALDDITFGSSRNDRIVVSLKQEYQADQYRDTTVKRFTMLREEDGWRIARETSLVTSSR